MPTIYAAALNFAAAYAELEPAMTAAPYNAPPQAPVLYIKPALCRIADGAPIPCPADTPALRMGGTQAVIIRGKRCQRAARVLLSASRQPALPRRLLPDRRSLRRLKHGGKLLAGRARHTHFR